MANKIPQMNAANNSDQVSMTLTTDELGLLNNALNEVLNGIAIDEHEFPTRLGASQKEATALLKRIKDLLRENRA